MPKYTEHRDYKTCNDCGANLDHGERCDCGDPKCRVCGDTLEWGRFAYNQDTCWICYKDACMTAIHKLESPEERQLLEHAMRMVAEFFKEVY